jgi:hypothetical protein
VERAAGVFDRGASLRWTPLVRVAWQLQHCVRMHPRTAWWADVFPVLSATLVAKEQVLLAQASPYGFVRTLPRVESVQESARRMSPVGSATPGRPQSPSKTGRSFWRRRCTWRQG